MLREKLPLTRAIGALTIVVGLGIAVEALTTIGTHGLLGDLSFMAAGIALRFSACCCGCAHPADARHRRGQPLSVLYVPVHGVLFGFHSVIRPGWYENFMQAVVQGVFAGPLPIFLFAHAVVSLGAGRP